MKIFFDTEFTGLHQGTTLISIGLVSEDSRTFYAEFTDYDKSQVNDWIKDNVIANLQLTDKIKVTNSSWEQGAIMYGAILNDFENEYKCIGASPMIANRLGKWLNIFKSVEIWSDCLAYDWVLFCQLFGGAMNIPKNTYYIPFDLCTLLKCFAYDPDCNREELAKIPDSAIQKHNALFDAKVIKRCYDMVKPKP